MKTKNYYLLLFIVIFAKCNIAGDCKNQIYNRINSPSGKYRIVKFDRDCGATTANSIQLSVIKTNDSLPDDGGNILIVNSKVGGAIESDTSVIASWMNDTVILIKYDRDLTIYEQNFVVDKTKIIYLNK